MSNTATPMQGRDRLLAVDVIRGVAILGILMINILSYSGPYLHMGEPPTWTTWDHGALLFIQMFGMGKFITLLSFMFGFGMVMIKVGAERRGAAFVPLYIRRLLALLVFGSLHAFLLWEGDILMVYAIVGFVLLLFHSFQARTLLIWGLVLMALVLSMVGLVFLSAIFLQAFPEAGGSTEDDLMNLFNPTLYASLIATYGAGTFSEIMVQRYADWQNSFFGTMPLWIENLGMMLLGAYVAKRRILHDLDEHVPFVKKVWLWSLILGVVLTGITFGLHYLVTPVFTLHLNLLDVFGIYLASPFLCIFYAASIALLLRRASWQKRLAPLASVGRMAFSVYIMQSIIATTIFYGYGFGWYGQVGAFWALMIAFAIWAVQIPFCMWWMRRFLFGPLEWLWRVPTYLKMPPMKRRAQATE